MNFGPNFVAELVVPQRKLQIILTDVVRERKLPAVFVTNSIEKEILIL